MGTMRGALTRMVKQGSPWRLVLLLPLAALLLGPLLSPSSAPAEESTQRLAVLELRGAFERDILSVFSDQVRQGALSSLKGTGYEVMTREHMATSQRICSAPPDRGRPVLPAAGRN